MKLTFKGKSAIVTGACGGIGIECVKKLNNAGLKVLMLDLKIPPANFQKKYKKVEFKKIDVINFDELKKTINKLPLPALPEFDFSTVLKIMQNDKKAQKGRLHFILIEDIGHAVVQHNIKEKSIINVLEDL